MFGKKKKKNEINIGNANRGPVFNFDNEAQNFNAQNPFPKPPTSYMENPPFNQAAQNPFPNPYQTEQNIFPPPPNVYGATVNNGQNPYFPPPPGYVPPEKQVDPNGIRAMEGVPFRQKNRAPIIRLISTIMFVFAIGFLSYYIYSLVANRPEQYDTIKKATVGQTYDGDAFIVRDETVFDDEGITDIYYVAKEGSPVSRTDLISYVYTSGYSDKERATLQKFRDRIKQYQLELLASENIFDEKMDRLVEDVNSKAVEVRNVMHGEEGNIMNIEKSLAQAIDERQAYFREKYAEDQKLSRLYDDESTQLKRIESWKKQNHATSDGIVSFYTDGYEYGIDINKLDEISTSDVRRYLNGEKPDEPAGRKGKIDIYRMVNNNDWFVLMLIKDKTWNPVQGSELTLTLKQFSNITVKATINSFLRSGDTLLLRLRIKAPVDQVLYSRSCSASIGQYADALSVSEKALHKQDGAVGVVVLSETKKLFVPVEIISQEKGLVYIKPTFNNTLYEGQSVLMF